MVVADENRPGKITEIIWYQTIRQGNLLIIADGEIQDYRERLCFSLDFLDHKLKLQCQIIDPLVGSL